MKLTDLYNTSLAVSSISGFLSAVRAYAGRSAICAGLRGIKNPGYVALDASVFVNRTHVFLKKAGHGCRGCVSTSAAVNSVPVFIAGLRMSSVKKTGLAILVMAVTNIVIESVFLRKIGTAGYAARICAAAIGACLLTLRCGWKEILDTSIVLKLLGLNDECAKR